MYLHSALQLDGDAGWFAIIPYNFSKVFKICKNQTNDTFPIEKKTNKRELPFSFLDMGAVIDSFGWN